MQKSKPNLIEGCSFALFESDLVATRLSLALAELLWAVMLLWPGDTFIRPTYFMMSLVANELTWAFVFLFSGIYQGYLVAAQKVRTRQAELFAWFNAVVWCCIVGFMLASVYPPPAAIGGEISLAVAAFWIAIRPALLKYIDWYATKTPVEIEAGRSVWIK